MKNYLKEFTIIIISAIMILISEMFTRYHHSLWEEVREGFSNFEGFVMSDEFVKFLFTVELVAGILIIYSIVRIVYKFRKRHHE